MNSPEQEIRKQSTSRNLEFLSKIDPTKLQTTLSKWLKTTYQQEADFSTVLIDGKALRATSSNAKEQAGFLNVFANELGIVIDQVPTGKGGQCNFAV